MACSNEEKNKQKQQRVSYLYELTRSLEKEKKIYFIGLTVDEEDSHSTFGILILVFCFVLILSRSQSYKLFYFVIYTVAQ